MSVFRILRDVAAVGREIVKEGVKFVVEQLSGEGGESSQGARPSDTPAEAPSSVAPETPPANEQASEDVVDAVADEKQTEAAPEEGPEGQAGPAEEKPEAQRAKKTRTSRKRSARKGTGEKKKTAVEVIYELIAEAEEGISTAELIEKTGYTPKKVHNNVYKLRKAGKIETIKKGYYKRT